MFLNECVPCTSAETSPTFWTRGLASLGLAGTRGIASLIGGLLSFKISPSGRGLASPACTRESQLTALPCSIYHSSSHREKTNRFWLSARETKPSMKYCRTGNIGTNNLSNLSKGNLHAWKSCGYGRKCYRQLWAYAHGHKTSNQPDLEICNGHVFYRYILWRTRLTLP